MRQAPGRYRAARRRLVVGSLAAALALTGCSSTVNLEPAPDAADPACAPAMVAMPTELTGLAQRETNAQATTAWGDPARIVLKCGVRVQEPVADPCVSVNGVDWTLAARGDESDPARAASATATAPGGSASGAVSGATPTPSAAAASSGSSSAGGTWTATTFGRTPTIQVTFDADQVSSSSLLTELDSAVKQIPQTKQCLSTQDLEYHE